MKTHFCSDDVNIADDLNGKTELVPKRRVAGSVEQERQTQFHTFKSSFQSMFTENLAVNHFTFKKKQKEKPSNFTQFNT